MLAWVFSAAAIHYHNLLTVDTGCLWYSDSEFLNKPATSRRTRIWKHQ